MSQKFTVLVDLDGTIVDTAPDLMNAHNYVMKKFGYETKTTEEIRNLVGKGAGALIGRSIWGTAKKEFGKISDKKVKDEMVKDFAICGNRDDALSQLENYNDLLSFPILTAPHYYLDPETVKEYQDEILETFKL